MKPAHPTSRGALQRTHLRWSQADSAGVALDHFSRAKPPDLVVPTVASFVLGH